MKKKLSKLPKYLSDFELKQILVFLKKSEIFDFFQIFLYYKNAYMCLLCALQIPDFIKKLKVNDLTKSLFLFFIIEKNKTKPGKWH